MALGSVNARVSMLGVYACAVMTFAFLTSEMLPIGLLPRIAGSLDVSLPDAGLLLSAYALVVTLAGPPLTAVVSGVARKRLMLALAGVLVVSTALCALAESYAFFMGARLLNALAHGIFWSIVATTAASLVAPGRRGLALAVIYAGSSVGTVLGVPLATLAGERLGWHAAFWCVSGLGALAFVTLATVPPIPPAKPSAIADIKALLTDLSFVRVLLTTTLVVIGTFTAFTYFTPLLAPVSRNVAGGIPTLLFLNGVAGLASTFVFGLIAGKRTILAIVVATVLVAVALGSLAICARTGELVPLTALPIIVLWGIGTGGVVVSLQARVLAAQPDKPDVASALNSSAFNLGIGGGAIVGGYVLRIGGLDAIPAVAALLIVPAIALQVVPTLALRRS